MAANLAEEATATMVGGFARLHPGEVAGILEDEPIDETAVVIESMPTREAAGVFRLLTPGTASGVLTQLADEKGRRADPGVGNDSRRVAARAPGR
jgi:Mg/Co/Ni transporter MgtE